MLTTLQTVEDPRPAVRAAVLFKALGASFPTPRIFFFVFLIVLGGFFLTLSVYGEAVENSSSKKIYKSRYINSDVSSRTWSWPPGASGAKNSGFGLKQSQTS